MKHGIFILVFFMLLCLSGCRAKKNTTRSTEIERSTQTESRKTDTARTVIEYKESEIVKDAVLETTERETIYLDTLGRIRSIVTESVRKEAGQRRIYRGQGSAVSVSGETDSTTVVEEMHQTANQSNTVDTDSRPVQGFEWVWIFIGIGLLGIVIILAKRFGNHFTRM